MHWATAGDESIDGPRPVLRQAQDKLRGNHNDFAEESVDG